MRFNLYDQEFAINTAADYMYTTNDYSEKTASDLIKAIYKNLNYVIAGFEHTLLNAIQDAIIKALCKKAASEGYDPDDYVNGVINNDGDWRIGISEDEKKSAKSFDAGRKWAEEKKYNWIDAFNKI